MPDDDLLDELDRNTDWTSPVDDLGPMRAAAIAFVSCVLLVLIVAAMQVLSS